MTLICVQIYNSYNHRYRIVTLLMITCVIVAIPVVAALFAYWYGYVAFLRLAARQKERVHCASMQNRGYNGW
ncbi:MAG: hypothetical protein AAF310_06445 [Myxococcota bacterium]